MNKDVAREIIRASFRSERELENLSGFLKERCGPNDYKELVRSIAIAIDGINVELVKKALTMFPDLKLEMESNLKRTGQVMP